MKALLSRARNKIIWKIFLIFWLTTFAIIIANIYITTEIVQSETRIDRLKNKMRYLAEEAVTIYEEQGIKNLRDWYKFVREREHVRVVLIDDQNQALGLPARWDKYLSRHMDREPSRHGPFFQIIKIVDQQITSISGEHYTLKLLPSKGLEYRFGPPAILHAYRIGITFLLILLGSWWLARSIARPVKVLEEASQRVASGDFKVRVADRIGHRRDELGELARAFDDMATKIENLIQSQQQLFSDISHDIRTPLTRQKLAIELARSTDNPGPLLDKLEQQNQVIEDLLDSLLTLLRLDNHNDYEACSLELNSVLTECIAQAEIDLANKSLHIKQDIEPALPVIGNRALLLRAFSNIIANAIKYSPENSDIDISAFRRADQIIVEIRDQGPGIVETELTSALEPFYRADRSRHADTGGYGLGLAIVNKIIQQHGGDVTLSNAQPSGLRVILSLPNS